MPPVRRRSRRPASTPHDLAQRALAALSIVFLCFAGPASAHIGSPDVFLDANAGPYRVLVTVKPPRAIPGVAEVEVMTTADDIREVRIVPLPLTGPGAQFAPAPDRATPSAGDPRLFTGQLWMMTAGAWQVRVAVDGGQGSGVVSVPVPTLPQATLAMGPALRGLLIALMLLLCAGFVSIVAALGREASLAPGESPGPRHRRRGRLVAAFATGAVIVVVWLGNWWWSAEASSYARYVYKPLEASADLRADGRLALALRDPGWISMRRTDDFVNDHGHPMHLFVVSPALDRLWHLHPAQSGSTFEQRMPDVPGGEYEIFADVVHESGISETIVSRFATEGVQGVPLSGDDSAWTMPREGVSADAAPLPGGGRIVWVRDRERPIEARALTLFTFRVEDASGQPAKDLELYMGMPGHAIFVGRDRTVFAHVHPSGSVPMAAIEISERSLAGATGADVKPDHAHHGMGLPATIAFPYGLPAAGDYRIFVQVKRAGRVETGAFDVRVN